MRRRGGARGVDLGRHGRDLAHQLLLRQRAQQLGLKIEIQTIADAGAAPAAHTPGQLPVLPVQLRKPVTAGQLDPANASYVLETLALGVRCAEAGGDRLA